MGHGLQEAQSRDPEGPDVPPAVEDGDGTNDRVGSPPEDRSDERVPDADGVEVLTERRILDRRGEEHRLLRAQDAVPDALPGIEVAGLGRLERPFRAEPLGDGTLTARTERDHL